MNTDFIQKENINTLWDVISDEDIFKFLPKDSQNKISKVFLNNIKGFYDTEKTNNNNLIELNKKYILLISNYIKNYYHHQPSKIKIYNDVPEQSKELITYEEIQNDKLSQFEKDFNKKQEEFTNAITLKVPPVPDFSDKYEDKPLNEIESIIKEMTAQRNYDIEQINKSYDTSKNDEWLNPQKTSIKKFNNVNNDNINSNTNKTKYANNLNKNVTWGENDVKEFDINDEMNNLENNIYSKLKKTNNSIFSQKNEDNGQNIDINNYNNRFNKIENDIQNINNKIDLIIKLLNK